MEYKILVLNPGSTSTKLAVYEDETPLFVETLVHTAEELAPFKRVVEQYSFRMDLVLDCLNRFQINPETVDAIVSRGGLLAPIRAGAYTINEDMIWQLEDRPRQEHASNVGPMIAYSLAQKLHIPAIIYDGITVDEMKDINRITGMPDMQRKGIGHNLNTRAVAMRYAKEIGKKYEDITVIAVHLGGGITVNLHHNGKIEDCISDEEGPLSPERAGGLPMYDVINCCFREGMTKEKMMNLVKRRGGFMAYLGTTDSRKVEHLAENGNETAKTVYEAMALNVAKHIGKLAPGVDGKVDAIILTGGIAYSKYITNYIQQRVSFIAPVIVYPGEDEMQSLAWGCLRVLRGQETARTYKRVENL